MRLTKERLVEIRTALGLSQEKMGRLLGVSFASVNRWERGRWEPLGLVLQVYQALHVTERQGQLPFFVRRLRDGADPAIFLCDLFVLAYGSPRWAPVRRPCTADLTSRVFLWSGEHQAFWRPDAAGYTTEIAEAGLFSRKEAERYRKGAGPEKMLEILSGAAARTRVLLALQAAGEQLRQLDEHLAQLGRP